MSLRTKRAENCGVGGRVAPTQLQHAFEQLRTLHERPQPAKPAMASVHQNVGTAAMAERDGQALVPSRPSATSP